MNGVLNYIYSLVTSEHLPSQYCSYEKLNARLESISTACYLKQLPLLDGTMILCLTYGCSLSNKNYVVQTKVLRTGHILIVRYTPFPTGSKTTIRLSMTREGRLSGGCRDPDAAPNFLGGKNAIKWSTTPRDRAWLGVNMGWDGVIPIF
jgi:hypothetical protein